MIRSSDPRRQPRSPISDRLLAADQLVPFGARADEAHGAAQDVEQLREFIEAGFTQEAADAGQAFVVFVGVFAALVVGRLAS